VGGLGGDNTHFCWMQFNTKPCARVGSLLNEKGDNWKGKGGLCFCIEYCTHAPHKTAIATRDASLRGDVV
jgi:hypothetical protein